MPTVSVTLPALQTTPLVTQRVVIKQELFKHDTAVFEINDAAAGRRIKLETPVSITWGFGKDADTFLGYVQSVRPLVKTAKTSAGLVQVVCIGASYALKNKNQKAHRGSRALIVQNICRVAKLTTAAEPTVGAIATNQAGKSDWEMLVQLAKEAGRVLFPHGVQINFVSKDFWLEKQGRLAPTLTYGQKPTEPGALLSFVPRLSNSSVDNPRGQFVIYYLDSGTKKVYAVTGDGQSKSPSRKDTGKTKFTSTMAEKALSLAEAVDRVKAKEELARFVHKAEVRCTGNARIHAGRPVYLRGVPEDTGGYWMVHTAVHTIDPTGYHCDLVIDTDSLGQETREPPMDAPVVPAVEDVIDPGFGDDLEAVGDDVIDNGIEPDAPFNAELVADDVIPFDPEGDTPVFGDDLLFSVMESEPLNALEFDIPREADIDRSWSVLPGRNLALRDEAEQGRPLVQTVAD